MADDGEVPPSAEEALETGNQVIKGHHRIDRMRLRQNDNMLTLFPTAEPSPDGEGASAESPAPSVDLASDATSGEEPSASSQPPEVATGQVVR